jgi:anti-sigma factor RsiW
MDCTQVREHLKDHRRGALPTELAEALEAHLAGCDACRHEDAADRELSLALEARLPKRQAPGHLRRSIEEQVRESTRPPARATRAFTAATVAAVVAIAAAVLLLARREPDAMVAEALNDHLRVLYSTHPVDVEGADVHRVKPWFEGKVDFAPVVAFGGDDDYPLKGGAVAYFIDRKAAAYVYERRLHVVTLLVYRADGLPWSTAATVALGHVRAAVRTTRGFNVLYWRDGDLGYAMVSDLNLQELETLGAKIAGG